MHEQARDRPRVQLARMAQLIFLFCGAYNDVILLQLTNTR